MKSRAEKRLEMVKGNLCSLAFVNLEERARDVGFIIFHYFLPRATLIFNKAYVKTSPRDRVLWPDRAVSAFKVGDRSTRE